MLNLNLLRQKCSEGESFEYFFFWGHQPSNKGIAKSCLSQWYVSPFEIDNVTYITAEHWMMAAKARTFQDEEILEKILKTTQPSTAKALGRKVKNFDDKIWKQQARKLVTQGDFEKFQQNKDLKNFLLATGNTVLVEASPYDRIWGIGMKADNEKASHPETWQGQNLLGFALMDVRQKLRSVV